MEFIKCYIQFCCPDISCFITCKLNAFHCKSSLSCGWDRIANWNFTCFFQKNALFKLLHFEHSCHKKFFEAIRLRAILHSFRTRLLEYSYGNSRCKLDFLLSRPTQFLQNKHDLENYFWLTIIWFCDLHGVWNRTRKLHRQELVNVFLNFKFSILSNIF